MELGMPGLRGTEHVGFTVPDLEEATRFFVDVIGCQMLFEVGPFVAEGDWMSTHMNVHPRTVMRKLRFFRCKYGSNFELFQYEAPDQNSSQPKNSDVGGFHLAFYVDDLPAAVEYLRQKRYSTSWQTYASYSRAERGTTLDLFSYSMGYATGTC